MDTIAAIQDFLTPLPIWTERGEVRMPLFGSGHRLWLIACVCVGFVLVSAHRGLASAPEKRRRFEIRIAAIPLVLLAIHAASMLAFDAFNPSCLPLHICNLCEVLVLVYALTGNEFSGSVLYGVGIVGSLAALLFPGWSYAPTFSLPSVCGFGEHLLVLLFIIMKLRDKSIRPAFDRLWQPLAFTGIYVAAVYPFNSRYGTNFAFINWAPYGTPLALWDEMCGNPGYIVIYVLVFIGLGVALFWPWRTMSAKKTG